MSESSERVTGHVAKERILAREELLLDRYCTYPMLEMTSSNRQALMQSTVHRVASISWSFGSGGSSFMTLDTYDVKAENRPMSVDLSFRSMTCAGLWSGIGGRSSFDVKEDKVVGMRELMKRLRIMRIICFHHQHGEAMWLLLNLHESSHFELRLHDR